MLIVVTVLKNNDKNVLILGNHHPSDAVQFFLCNAFEEVNCNVVTKEILSKLAAGWTLFSYSPEEHANAGVATLKDTVAARCTPCKTLDSNNNIVTSVVEEAGNCIIFASASHISEAIDTLASRGFEKVHDDLEKLANLGNEFKNQYEPLVAQESDELKATPLKQASSLQSKLSEPLQKLRRSYIVKMMKEFDVPMKYL